MHKKIQTLMLQKQQHWIPEHQISFIQRQRFSTYQVNSFATMQRIQTRNFKAIHACTCIQCYHGEVKKLSYSHYLVYLKKMISQWLCRKKQLSTLTMTHLRNLRKNHSADFARFPQIPYGLTKFHTQKNLWNIILTCQFFFLIEKLIT